MDNTHVLHYNPFAFFFFFFEESSQGEFTRPMVLRLFFAVHGLVLRVVCFHFPGSFVDITRVGKVAPREIVCLLGTSFLF